MSTNKPDSTPRAKPDRSVGETDGIAPLWGGFSPALPDNDSAESLMEYSPPPEFADEFNKAMEELKLNPKEGNDE